MKSYEEKIWNMAVEAALQAADECSPVPMVVGMAKGLTGSEMIPGTEEFVEEGVCGFAWIKIKPARGKFVKYLKENKLGSRGVYGGFEVFASSLLEGSKWQYGQGMQRKEAACEAACEVLVANGINAYAYSRID